MVSTNLVHPPPDYGLGSLTGASFVPKHILYYKLYVLAANKSRPDDWEYQYLYGSGLRDSVDIAAFIESVLAHSPTTQGNLPPPVTIPDITVTDPCYVVIELSSDDTTVQFQANVPAIKTVDPHMTDYVRLAHVDSPSGDIHFGAASGACNLIYFAVKDVKLATQNPQVDDHFNIYLQYGAAPTSVYVKDPAIKNRGGTGLLGQP